MPSTSPCLLPVGPNPSPSTVDINKACDFSTQDRGQCVWRGRGGSTKSLTVSLPSLDWSLHPVVLSLLCWSRSSYDLEMFSPQCFRPPKSHLPKKSSFPSASPSPPFTHSAALGSRSLILPFPLQSWKLPKGHRSLQHLLSGLITEERYPRSL